MAHAHFGFTAILVSCVNTLHVTNCDMYQRACAFGVSDIYTPSLDSCAVSMTSSPQSVQVVSKS